MNQQPEFNLTDPDHPTSIECTGAELPEVLAGIEAKGGQWNGIKVGSSPGVWIIRPYWPSTPQAKHPQPANALPGSASLSVI